MYEENIVALLIAHQQIQIDKFDIENQTKSRRPPISPPASAATAGGGGSGRGSDTDSNKGQQGRKYQASWKAKLHSLGCSAKPFLKTIKSGKHSQDKFKIVLLLLFLEGIFSQDIWTSGVRKFWTWADFTCQSYLTTEPQDEN